MTGRGRPRKAEKTNGAESKTTQEEMKKAVTRSRRKNVTEEKHDDTAKPKEMDQTKANHTPAKPSVPGARRGKTTKHTTEELNKQQRTPSDDTRGPVKGTKAKTCSDRAKSAEEIKGEQQETPKDTTEVSVETTKPRKCPLNSKSTKHFEETMTTQSETPNSITQESFKITDSKAHNGKAKSAEKFREEAMKDQQETPKHTTNPEIDSILYTTLEKLKIRKNDKANASEIINPAKKKIFDHVKQNIEWFKEVESVPTGSYYENLKISDPDEFDIMLAIPLERVNIRSFGEDGAYFSVGLKRGNSPLKKFQENETLSASKMLSEFREEVKKCVKELPGWQMAKMKQGCPAVTLTGPRVNADSEPISLDVVLCLKVKSSWPEFTHDGFQIQRWLGTKVMQEYKRKPYYFVAKHEGDGEDEHDGIKAKDVWRISFSHIEKDIMRNHGSEKTCCEREGKRCCRKDCLKLLKHLLSLLKEKKPRLFSKFCSYHAKTTLLHACCLRVRDSDWEAESLSRCFIQLLQDFLGYLEKGVLPNFFIKRQNLLAGIEQKNYKKLACCIKEELEKGFPIFM
ncbi:cyclic GMP-AMP synthase [Echeneis naucrates]|uniref:Uncharacterized protein n=1 Tax=Echeneis naucrates TaxID=173247 RepID=A0A665T9D1_ECHNA|nr:cyclic GMP-AMP synthase [Echeneis naucrates]